MLAVTLLTSLVFAACVGRHESYDLAHVHPSEAGWSEHKLKDVEKHAGALGCDAVMALKGRKVFFSWGNIARKYPCHSIRKPFVSALYGLYVERGLIDLDATLQDLSIDDIPPSLTAEEKRATIRDLLASRSGVYHQAAAESTSMRDKRPSRGSHPPGTHFYYNNWDFNALGTILERSTGRSVFETFREEIAVRIGMQDFSLADCRYLYERGKSSHPAYTFNMSTRDLARFGLLYLNRGRWGGERILDPGWVDESTSPHSVKALAGDPYGLMWSIIPESSGYGGGYYHTGLGVHLLAVLPAQDIVLVHRVDTRRATDITWPQIRDLMEMILTARE